MRMFVLALALLPAAANAGAPDPKPRVQPAAPVLSLSGRVCHNAGAEKASPDAKVVKPRRLAEEPAAEAYYTVLRLENGCDKPVLVRERRQAR
ncbi:MAG: hypothetical protein J7500_00805 [Sphingomonas sp.]|uniref:hypothetical protein n=1 Tax=Sphingomonas sp. TaxID=28214 RepID=UPI001B0F71E2|nr:hypothetical protein [Sphingomonas sp.]MBO9621228.1 hypothetical protein [Sphingomonas sp.]